MKKVLKDFLKNKINLNQVKSVIGNNLHKVQLEEPITVCSKDVIFLLEQYIKGNSTLHELLDRVNVIWFTDLFTYNEAEEDSIASVMDKLESLDEVGVSLSDGELSRMIECLSENKEYRDF